MSIPVVDQFCGALADVPDLAGGVSHHKPVGRHIAGDHGTSTDQSKGPNSHTGQDDRACANRCAVAHAYLPHFPIVVAFQRSIRIDGTWFPVIGKDDTRADEDPGFDRRAVVNEGAVLDLDAITDLDAEINVDILADDALGSN
jgi:hypothetical protein